MHKHHYSDHSDVEDKLHFILIWFYKRLVDILFGTSETEFGMCSHSSVASSL